MPDATAVTTPIPARTDAKRDRHDAYSRRLLEEAAQAERDSSGRTWSRQRS